MRYSLLVPLACLALPSLGLAQGSVTLNYHPDLGSEPSASEGVGEVARYVSLAYNTSATLDTLTVVLMHVAVDPDTVTDPGDRRWLAGLFSVYPFLAPRKWAPQPAVVVAGYTVNTQEPPAIPSNRLNTHLSALAQYTSYWPVAGHTSTGITTSYRLPDNEPWAGTSIGRADERYAFAVSDRAFLSANPKQVYDFTQLTRNSVVQAANHYGQSWNLTVLDQALTSLNNMLGDQTQFIVTVQAIDVHPTGGPNNTGLIRFRPPAVVHRRSLKVQNLLAAPVAPNPRWVPWVIGANASAPTNVNLYLAARESGSASVLIAFPQAYSNLTAQFPTFSGPVSVTQSGPAIPWGTGVYLVQFAYPAGVNGFTASIYRTLGYIGGVPTLEQTPPLGALNGEAVVWSYDYQESAHWQP